MVTDYDLVYLKITLGRIRYKILTPEIEDYKRLLRMIKLAKYKGSDSSYSEFIRSSRFGVTFFENNTWGAGLGIPCHSSKVYQFEDIYKLIEHLPF